MSATEDDTELRDLLIQNLENTGVLNKLKAEMRAAVFLAMEEQDRLENKSSLINEQLKKCLNTTDGRVVAGLIADFLQVFHLDFTLAVFQPEVNSLSGLDGRESVCRDLDLSESDVNKNCPLLLELVRRRRRATEIDRNIGKEPSQKQIAHARKKFDFYDKDGSGSVLKDDLKSVFTDLFPGLNRSMLESFVSDELRAEDRSFSKTVDFQLFLGLYRRLFSDCRSVVIQDSDVRRCPEDKPSSPPVSKDSDGVASPGKADFQQQRLVDSAVKSERVDLDLQDDLDDGDSFFDDPLPKPQKTYGCLSVLAADSDVRLSELRKAETSRARDSPAGSLSETQRPGGAGGAAGGSSMSEQSHSRSGASNSNREKVFRDPKTPNDKTGSLHLDDDVEYDDDFNSHRSDLSKSELSIGEEIEEVSIEGPDHSDKFDGSTQDLSVSQLSQSHGADYMEEVAISSTSSSHLTSTCVSAEGSQQHRHSRRPQQKKMEEFYDGNETYFDMNCTGDDCPPEPCPLQNNQSVELVVGPYVHSIICILGFVGNSLVIVTYAFYKRTKSMTDVYLLNVAIADLLFVVSLPLIVYNELSSWSMGLVACKLLRGSYSVNLYSGMLLLACISTDRYIAIVQARRSFRLRSLTYSRLICFIVWVSAILLSVPTFCFYTLYKPAHSDVVYIDEDEKKMAQSSSPSQDVCELKFTDSNMALNTKVAIPSVQLALGFFLPLVVMVCCYTSIIVTLLRAKNFQRHKAVRVVLAVVAVFIACHMPYNMALLYDTATMFREQKCQQVDTLQVAKTVTQTIAYLHCCLNPVLYAFVGVKFRNHFRRIFQDLWCLGKKYIAPQRLSRTVESYASTRRSVDGSSENGSSFTM
ncbi:hypothetical protein E3U43_017203 [Larimichthys crocea]|uniref:Uncharacterized protein n=1 Tax=Larimichthys crocea TaxID=215358 RepID=A0ACD3QYN2_LARCR|nr:hypothetical protein E3U43_017203 [Larimichthys crocea]